MSSRGRCGPSSSRTITVPVRAVAGQCTSRIGSPSTYSRTPRVISWPLELERGRASASRSEPCRRLVPDRERPRRDLERAAERDADPPPPAHEPERARAAHLDDDAGEHAALRGHDAWRSPWHGASARYQSLGAASSDADPQAAGAAAQLDARPGAADRPWRPAARRRVRPDAAAARAPGQIAATTSTATSAHRMTMSQPAPVERAMT